MVKSAWSSADSRGSSDGAEQVGVDQRHHVVEALGRQPLDAAGRRVAANSSRSATVRGLVRRHLDGAGRVAPDVDVAAGRQVDLGDRSAVRGRARWSVSGTWKYSSAATSSPSRSSSSNRPKPGLPMSAASLQRTRYGCVRARRRADARRPPRRRSGPASAPTASLRRSSGTCGIGERHRVANDTTATAPPSSAATSAPASTAFWPLGPRRLEAADTARAPVHATAPSGDRRDRPTPTA